MNDRKKILAKFKKASSTLFELEKALPVVRRLQVYALRVELGNIENSEITKHEREQMWKEES